MMQPSVAAVVLVMAFACPALARGEGQQGASSPVRREAGRPGSFTLSVGGELLTPQGLGSTTATMRSNNQQGTTYRYFVTAGNRVAAPAFRGRVGYNITPMLTVEGGLVVSRGNVQGKVSADVENAAPLTVAERMTQYFVDASVLAHLRQLAFSNGAGVPFLEAGGGYLRQLHEGNLAMNTGQIYHLGGGVTYLLLKRPASRLTGIAVRADARVYIPRKGYSFGRSQQLFAAFGGSLLFTF